MEELKDIEGVGCVYFFRHIGLTPVKIGYSSSISPLDRFERFKTYAPYGAEILGFIPTKEAKKLEEILHKRYHDKRLSGEWFEITNEEVQREIKCNTESIFSTSKTEFELVWSRRLNDLQNKTTDIQYLLKSGELTKRQILQKLYKENKDLNRSKLAKELGVTRQCIIMWINKEVKLNTL